MSHDDDTMELTEAEANAIKTMRERGLSTEDAIAKLQESGAGNKDAGADGSQSNKPVTQAELDARVARAQREAEARASTAAAAQELRKTATNTIKEDPRCKGLSDRKVKQMVDRAFELARADDAAKGMSSEQIVDLIAAKAGVAVDEEHEDARSLAGLDKNTMQKRLDAQDKAGEGSGRSRHASGGSQDEDDSFAVSGMRFGTADQKWPTESEVYEDTADAAEKFLRKARAKAGTA